MNLQLPESLKISSLHFVHSRYGNKGLQKMLVTIRKHSKGAILDAPDELYVVAIKSIDEYLLRARDTHGGWNKGLIASNHGDKSSDDAMQNVLSRRRVASSRIGAIELAMMMGEGGQV